LAGTLCYVKLFFIVGIFLLNFPVRNDPDVCQHATSPCY